MKMIYIGWSFTDQNVKLAARMNWSIGLVFFVEIRFLYQIESIYTGKSIKIGCSRSVKDYIVFFMILGWKDF